MSAETFLGGRVTLHGGDCRDVLAAMPAESVDSIVCDPPYHLSSIVKRFGGAAAKAAQSNGDTGVYGRASAGFMGQAWDGGDVAFRAETWQAAARVLKPGGHLLAFSAPRTFGRMQVAIESAGFEMRDAVLNIADSGARSSEFLASLTVEQMGALAELVEAETQPSLLAWLFASGFPKSHDVARGIDRARTEDVEPLRTVCRFVRTAMEASDTSSADLAPHFGVSARMVDHWAARDTDSQPTLPTPGQWLTLCELLPLTRFDGFDAITAEVARLNARKGEPSDDFAGAGIVGEHADDAHCQRWKATCTDAGHYASDRAIRERVRDTARQWEGWGTALKPAFEPITVARKPLGEKSVAANVLAHGTGAINVDGCRIGLQSGADPGRWPANVTRAENDRYFFAAKASAADRVKADRDGPAHPTVKPVDLMRWLCRLVTPPGGTVLDPFAGTGTTGAAAYREGFNAVLIELNAPYRADIAERMRLEATGPMERAASRARAAAERPPDDRQGLLI